jgi:NADH-quinone oxidoreductase subunit F
MSSGLYERREVVAVDRLKSTIEFHQLRERLIADADLSHPVVVIPAGTCGQASGANDLIRVAKRELLARGLTNRVGLRITGCHGFCEMEPSVLVEPNRTFYPRVTTDGMARIIEATAAGTVLEDLLLQEPVTGRPLQIQEEVPFFGGQQRTLMARNECLDPIRIFNAVQCGGYTSFVRALEAGDPEAVLDAIDRSGLRGRGGAGFPTARKWRLLREQPGTRAKALVCNADEGDPGAYMDRSLLEGNPHSVIEGMLIGAFATGADRGVIYVRAEYPLAIKHLVIALRQARSMGLLGDDILGSGLAFDIELVRGAGAFVCGEETALIASIEGRMGEPRQRPPFPIERGINGTPTAINNVETWANVPVVLGEGGDRFRAIGTEGSSGTKVFSLVGKVKNTGLVEVPMGTPVHSIVYGIGGGSSGGGRLKAVQTGGPSGGCIPADRFDLTMDYQSLKQVGSIMGSGGMIVMDEGTCMVDLARYYMSFLADESCGKCFTCRKGTQRMHELLSDIADGRATLADLDLLEELAEVVRDTSMCGLGQSAPNPVLSTLRYFREEFVEHVMDQRCRAGVCRDLVGAACQSACPVGTEAWRYVAHIERGEYEDAYRVIREANPFPSVCARVCHHPCEASCRLGTTGDRPVAVRALKRFVTDTVDPGAWKPEVTSAGPDSGRVAVVGSGPAGLAAAHELSRSGVRVTVFEADEEPGGMLLAGVPSYRLPRDVVRREVAALLDDPNIELRCSVTLGAELELETLLDQEGFDAVFLAIGAHRSRQLGLEHEDGTDGVYSSMRFLKAFNQRDQSLARGRVGVIGGGNSAIDAARVALRQEGVDEVTIFYRRTSEEMPAIPEEVAAAREEGIHLEELVTPVRLHAAGGRLRGVDFIRNRLGDFDASGRRRPEPEPGTELTAELDTLVVAIG